MFVPPFRKMGISLTREHIYRCGRYTFKIRVSVTVDECPSPITPDFIKMVEDAAVRYIVKWLDAMTK
ncbi:hypothetical protein DRN94_003525 [archaeon]|nr:hypothetical protein [archaeon]